MIKKDPQEELDEQIKKKLENIEKSLSKEVTSIPKGDTPLEPTRPAVEPTLPPTPEPIVNPEPTPEQTPVTQPLPKTEPAKPVVEPISPPPTPPKPETTIQPEKVIEKKGDEAGALIPEKPEPVKDIIFDKQLNADKSVFSRIELPVKKEIDRIDEAIAGMETSMVDDLAVHVPFRRVLPGGGGLVYDYVYVGGKKLTVPEKTTNFLKVYLDGTTTPEWVAGMPDDEQDSNAEVFDVTRNQIHLPGNFGGG